MLIVRVLRAELLKLKRTLAFRMIFVAPLIVATLQFFVIWRSPQINARFKLWETLPRNSLSVWAVFLMPLMITLETALLSGIEHNDHQWKHILALPVPRHLVYFTKFIAAQALIASSTLILCVLTVLVGLVAPYLRPELVHSGPVPWAWIARHATMVWLAAWLIIAIHTWVAVRWSAFTVAVSVGMSGTFFAIFASGAKVAKYYPWLLPVNVFTDDRINVALWLGALGGVAAAVAGCLEFVRRDVA